MVTVASLKSFIAWIWTWVVNDWIIKDGMLTVYMTVAALNVVAYMSTFLFYFKGKVTLNCPQRRRALLTRPRQFESGYKRPICFGRLA